MTAAPTLFDAPPAEPRPREALRARLEDAASEYRALLLARRYGDARALVRSTLAGLSPEAGSAHRELGEARFVDEEAVPSAASVRDAALRHFQVAEWLAGVDPSTMPKENQ